MHFCYAIKVSFFIHFYRKDLSLHKNPIDIDIGVAMGVTGTEVAKDAAAMVLTDDNFATIVKAVENGRNLYQNIKNAIQFLLSGNFGAILAVLCAPIAGLPVPFAPVHLLFINLLTDSLPAIALGMEPHRSEVMNEKPRSADESILTKDFLSKIGLEGFVIGAMTMIGFLTGYHQNGALLGSTYAFGTLCLARLFHGFNCKSDHPVIFTKVFFNNKCLQGAFALGGAIAFVINVPMSFLEKIILGKTKENNQWAKKLARPVSLFLTIILLVSVIGLVIFGVIPQLTQTTGNLMTSIADFIPQMKNWIREFSHDNQEIMKLVNQLQFNPDQAIKWGISILGSGAGNMMNTTMSALGYIASGLATFFIAFTALIPIFGAFIGCAVGVFLIFMVSPKQAVLFIIIFLLLQQIEGNLIYPHVVGGSVGLPSIWVLAAVTIGGNLMGIVGMLIFIPTVSVFYTIFREYVYLRLKKQNIKRVTRTEVEEYDKRV